MDLLASSLSHGCSTFAHPQTLNYQRAESKDYLDLLTIIHSGINLSQAMAAARAIYGEQYNPMLTLKSLTHFGDGDPHKLTRATEKGTYPNRDRPKARFTRGAKNLNQSVAITVRWLFLFFQSRRPSVDFKITSAMIKGLRTALYPAPDLPKAKAWYELVFQRKPYFDEPFYVGFEISGFELGLVPDAQPSSAGPKALWGVDDLAQELQRLRSAGITVTGDIQDVGGGIKVADIADPFGNLVGLIENPHFTKTKIQ